MSLSPPWTIVPKEKNGQSVVCSQQDGTVIARVDSGDVPNPKTRVRIARLLSAAPELAEVAEALIKEHNMRYPSHSPCLCEQCVKLEAALEKARGRKLRSLER